MTKKKASMICMSDNDKNPSRYFGDSSQLTNWILDSVLFFSYDTTGLVFYPGIIRNTDKCIEVAGGNYITAKKKYKFK